VFVQVLEDERTCVTDDDTAALELPATELLSTLTEDDLPELFGAVELSLQETSATVAATAKKACVILFM